MYVKKAVVINLIGVIIVDNADIAQFPRRVKKAVNFIRIPRNDTHFKILIIRAVFL